MYEGESGSCVLSKLLNERSVRGKTIFNSCDDDSTMKFFVESIDAVEERKIGSLLTEAITPGKEFGRFSHQ